MFSKNPLTSQAFMNDPESVLGVWRRQAPLVRQHLPIIGKVWVATTQSAGSRILKDNACFGVLSNDGKVAGVQWWMPSSIQRLTNNMLSTDEPVHTRLRSRVDKAFARSDILAMEPRIRKIADQLALKMFSNGHIADLLTEFARPLPLAVICELLGLPDEDRPYFSKWAQGLAKVEGILSFMVAMRGVGKLTKYLDGRIGEIRSNGGEGLIAELVQNEGEDDPLSADELVSMVFLLLVAGHETTTHLITGGMWTLLTHKEQRLSLQNNLTQMPLAIEEMLRFVSPVQMSKPRHVRKDVIVEGVQLREGELVMVSLTAANMDPEVFDSPKKFDVTRKPNPHMSFGSGIHFCLGHQLARLEAKIAFETLFTQYPELCLANPKQEAQWNNRLGLRALKTLMVRPTKWAD